ncbi:MAG: HEPN domain-containing protein [Lachnospiraceae bacterium]|nr:HEPN domain-containing protein [Lachnospiraceae bacterium]
MDNLIQYRLASAHEKLESAKVLLEAQLYKDSVGRSYYAIFSAIRAILAMKQVDFSKHAGVIAYFQKEYIKTEVFDKKYSKYLQQAFQIRNSCDYDDFYIVSKQDAEEQYERAVEIIKVVEGYVKEFTN